jgi:uncharacterized membrane protein
MIVAIVLSSVLSLLVLVLALVLPAVTSPTVPFGVRVPSQHANEPVIVRQTLIYRVRVVVIDIVAAGVCVATYAVTGETLLLPLSVLVLLGVWYCCFFLANHEVRTAKAAGGWYEGVRQGMAVDTALRTDPPRFPWLWLAPPVVITLATVVIGALMYRSMPDVLNVHYAANGVPNRQAAKSVGTAFALVFVQIGVTALLTGVAATVVFRSRSDLDPAHPVSSSRWHRHYTELGAKALLGLVAMIDLGMLGSSLLTWIGTATHWAPLVVVIPILLAVAVTFVVLARNNRVRDDGEQDTGLSHRDDDRYWRGGLFYVNRDDHSVFVPRRFGIGWTLNFGNPRAAMFLLGILAVVALAITLRLGG